MILHSGFKAAFWTPVLVLAVFGLILAANLIPTDMLGLRENPYLAVVVIELMIYAVPSLFYCRIRGREFTPKLRLRLFPPSQLLYLLQAFLFLSSVTVILSVLLYRIAPEAFTSSSVTEYAAFAFGDRVFDGLYLVVAFAVLPALTEEFLFRGVVIGEYEKYGAPLAAFVSAAMFAMSHFSLARFPVYFVAGLVLASVLYATRSLLAAILVHACYDAAVVLGERTVLYIADKQNISMLLLVILLCAVALFSGMLMCFEAQHIYRGYAEANVPTGYEAKDKRSPFARIAEAFFTPTFLVLVLVFVVAAVAGH